MTGKKIRLDFLSKDEKRRLKWLLQLFNGRFSRIDQTLYIEKQKAKD